MSRFKGLGIPSRSPSGFRSSADPHITPSPAPDLAWSAIQPGKDHLLNEFLALYWEGVKGELENVIRTLRTWQQPQFSEVAVDEENDDFVHGFDTFIDQVCEETRRSAIGYGRLHIK